MAVQHRASRPESGLLQQLEHFKTEGGGNPVSYKPCTKTLKYIPFSSALKLIIHVVEHSFIENTLVRHPCWEITAPVATSLQH